VTRVALVVAAACAVLSPALAAQVFRGGTGIVVIDASVNDGRKPVLDLTKDDFELRDNGVPQTIADFDREKLPLDITLTIDVSGSMTPAKRASVQRAIAQVGASLHTDDRTAIETFAVRTVERRPLGPPPLVAEIVTSGSGTSIVDALLLSLVTAPVPDRRQLELFMTDGDDTTSVFDSATVIDTARFASRQTSFVIVRDRGRLEGPMSTIVRTIALTTGGQTIEIKGNDDLSEAFLAAIENFRTSYVLRYTPIGVSSSGWHEVDVKVKKSKYSVRARRGYWAR
jgi:hypothetical protein